MNEEILEITKKFHDTYEKLSKEYNYETKKETRVFDINSSNGKLMYATVNEIISPVLEENQELKKKYENAVADYEKTMFEKEQLNSLVNSCQEEIRQLKKQVENYKELGFKYLQDKNNKLETQQKEFINYLEDEINKLKEQIKNYDIWHEVGTDINFLILKK